jgi:hypothetical protein
VGPRFRAASRDRLKGTVQAVDESVLSLISDDHQLVKVPRASITRLEPVGAAGVTPAGDW